jgi:hypothetical protein
MRTFAAKLLMLAALSAGFSPPISRSQNPTAPPDKPKLSRYKFAGAVQILGQPADVGTFVQIVVFDAVSNYVVCADTTVIMQNIGTVANPNQVIGYIATLYDTPQCVNPDNRYDFYVNGVWGGSTGFEFAENMPSYKNMNVAEVALRSNSEQGGVRLVWLYGKVFDTINRPAVPGTPVTAKAVGAACGGSGKTEDLYWVPKAPRGTPVGEKGFFWIGIEKTPACQNRSVTFEITVPGMVQNPPPRVTITTPSYGMASATPGISITPK